MRASTASDRPAGTRLRRRLTPLALALPALLLLAIAAPGAGAQTFSLDMGQDATLTGRIIQDRKSVV